MDNDYEFFFLDKNLDRKITFMQLHAVFRKLMERDGGQVARASYHI